MISTRLRPRVLLAVATVLTVTLLTTRPASAHGAEGKMTLLHAEQTAPLHAQIEIGLLYANDSDVAEEATVSVTLTGPDGATVGPVPMPRTTGARYATEVDVPAPGTWSFTVTAAAPAASVTGTVDLTAPATTTTAAPVTTAVAVPSMGQASPPAAADDAAGPSPAWLAAVTVLAAAAVVAGGLILQRRRSHNDVPGTEPADTDFDRPVTEPAEATPADA